MRIVNFGQIIDLDGGRRIAHQITVELETGRRQQIQTDEGTVQQLLDAITDDDALPFPARVAPDDEDQDSGEVLVDGDMEVPGTADWVGSESVMGVMADERVDELPARLGGLGHPPMDGYVYPPKLKTVPKDEMGYPIVQSRSRAAPDNAEDDEEDDGDQI